MADLIGAVVRKRKPSGSRRRTNRSAPARGMRTLGGFVPQPKTKKRKRKTKKKR